MLAELALILELALWMMMMVLVMTETAENWKDSFVLSGESICA